MLEKKKHIAHDAPIAIDSSALDRFDGTYLHFRPVKKVRAHELKPPSVEQSSEKKGD